MNKNIEDGFKIHEYKGFKYYSNNPSLTINEAVERILKDCKLI